MKTTHNFLLNVFSTFFAKIVSFFVVSAYAVSMGATDYGLAELYFYIASLIGVLINGEFFQFLATDLQKKKLQKQKSLMVALVSKVMLVWVISTLLLALFLFKILNLISAEHFFLFSIFQMSISFSNLTMEYFRWSGNAFLYSIMSLSQSVVWLIYSVGIFYFELVSVPIYISGLVFSHLPILLVGVLKWRKTDFANYRNLLCSFLDIKLYFVLGGPLVLATFGQLVFHGFDKIFVAYFLEDATLLGLISFSYRIAWAGMSFLTIASQVTIQPFLVRIQGKRRTRWIKQIQDILPFAFMSLLGLVSCLAIVLSKQVHYISFLSEYHDAIKFLPWHLIAIGLMNIQIFRPELLVKRNYYFILFSLIAGLTSMLITALFFEDVGKIMYFGAITYSSMILWKTDYNRNFLLLGIFINLVPLIVDYVSV